MPGTIITTLLVGYIYELFGRKMTIFVSYILSGIVYLSFPYTAPDYNMLIIARCILGVTIAAPLAHPLIPDYIKRSSRGKAVALCGVGAVLGEVFSMGVLFNLTKSMNFYTAFRIASGLILLFAIYLFIFI